MRVVDPACGTGGFLVYFLLSSIELANEQYKAGKITSARRNQLIENLKKKVFFGADAHEGVAASAKMNMIIAGDGHSNIQCQDSLSKSSTIWSAEYPKIDLIITNPPFGTSETENIIQSDLDQFPVKSSKGQILFVQKMVQSTIPGGEICTVIDEGLLNTDQAAALRAYIMEHTLIRGIVRLPDVTFKPNKINVRSSILHLIKRGEPNPDLDDDYPILFLDVFTLGYQGSGELIRNQNFHSVLSEIGDEYHGVNRENVGASGQKAHWRWFTRSSLNLAQDATKRFDLKYWDPSLIERLVRLSDSGVKTIKELNQVKTKRGKSPAASLYVDEADGYALVIKAGTNITRQGTVISTEDSDFIEKNVYDEMSAVHVQDGDILLSSTGDGTLGKCAVFRGKIPAIYDGHVTLIRVDSKKIYPEYVCDYLRLGFGQDQISRLYTGSTGLIELPPDQVDRILVQLPSINLQKSLSKSLRKAENNHLSSLDFAKALLIKASEAFRNH
jgi:type I restriction enzyme M protein